MGDTSTYTNYIFGYGSIINNRSRTVTRNLIRSTAKSDGVQCNAAVGNDFEDNAVAAGLTPLKYCRQWCFKSDTGFTALGLTLKSQEDVEAPLSSAENFIFGVLFPVTDSELTVFDEREVNYHRIQLGVEDLIILPQYGSSLAQNRARLMLDPSSVHYLNSKTSITTIWTYIPDDEYNRLPSPEYPILTTYLDICLTGCYEWGAGSNDLNVVMSPDLKNASSKMLMLNFLATTHGWNKYFLDDTPMSRRPWLHRSKHYKLIDACLREYDEVRFNSRMHSEEYAAHHLTLLRGSWGVPSKNPLFVGRKEDMNALHTALLGEQLLESSVSLHSEVDELAGVGFEAPISLDSDIKDCSIRAGSLQSKRREVSSGSTLTVAEVVGQAGIGKSSLAAEYCWRYNVSNPGALQTQLSHNKMCDGYGLIVWLRAETEATLADDLKQFALDVGIISPAGGSIGKSTSPTVDDGSSAGATFGSKSAPAPSKKSNSSIEDSIVIREVHKRLAHCRCNWLLVFDNVENMSILENYLPRHIHSRWREKIKGSKQNSREASENICRSEQYSCNIQQSGGHSNSNLVNKHAVSPRSNGVCDYMQYGKGAILITSRIKIPNEQYASMKLYCCHSLQLSCFNSAESVQYLNIYLGSGGKYGDQSACFILAERLGHLPLALSVAAAYIYQCDVCIDDYLVRLNDMLSAGVSRNLDQSGADVPDQGQHNAYTASLNTISASVIMTLRQIKSKSGVAHDVLCCLSFLHSNNISKELIHELVKQSMLKTKVVYPESEHVAESKPVQLNSKRWMDGIKQSEAVFCIPGDKTVSVGMHSYAEPAVLHFTHRDMMIHSLCVCFMSSSILLLVFKIFFQVDSPGVWCAPKIGFGSPNNEGTEYGFSMAVVAALVGSLCSLFMLWVASVNQKVFLEKCSQLSSASHEVEARNVGDFQPDTLNPKSVANAEVVSTLVKCDDTWHILKQFSLLQVQRDDASLQLHGSIHRLQLSVIRMVTYNGDEDANKSTSDVLKFQSSCVHAMENLWQYSLYDARTWIKCGELLPHIETLHLHLMERYKVNLVEKSGCDYFCSSTPEIAKIAIKLVKILTECACYSATSSSQFETSQKLVQSAASLYHFAVSGVGLGKAELSAVVDSYSVRADILHCGGKVYRYQGQLQHAKCTLGLALQIKYQLVCCLSNGDLPYFSMKPVVPVLAVARELKNVMDSEKTKTTLLLDTAVSFFLYATFSSIAHTLHELGVVFVRLRDKGTAEMLFRTALMLKQQCSSAVAHSDSIHLGEAATYHQLGVICINHRQYDDAEEYLVKALKLEYGVTGEELRRLESTVEMGSFSVIMGIVQQDSYASSSCQKSSHDGGNNMVAKAATLQQLGRLYSRKGKEGSMGEAEVMLQQSLALFENVYGGCKESKCLQGCASVDGLSTDVYRGGGAEDIIHINLASVRHQLGLIAFNQKHFEESRAHASIALRIRESISKYDADLGFTGISSGDDINAFLEIIQEVQLIGKSTVRKVQQFLEEGAVSDSVDFDGAVGLYYDSGDEWEENPPKSTTDTILRLIEDAASFFVRQRTMAEELLVIVQSGTSGSSNSAQFSLNSNATARDGLEKLYSCTLSHCNLESVLLTKGESVMGQLEIMLAENPIQIERRNETNAKLDENSYSVPSNFPEPQLQKQKLWVLQSLGFYFNDATSNLLFLLEQHQIVGNLSISSGDDPSEKNISTNRIKKILEKGKKAEKYDTIKSESDLSTFYVTYRNLYSQDLRSHPKFVSSNSNEMHNSENSVVCCTQIRIAEILGKKTFDAISIFSLSIASLLELRHQVRKLALILIKRKQSIEDTVKHSRAVFRAIESTKVDKIIETKPVFNSEIIKYLQDANNKTLSSMLEKWVRKLKVIEGEFEDALANQTLCLKTVGNILFDFSDELRSCLKHNLEIMHRTAINLNEIQFENNIVSLQKLLWGFVFDQNKCLSLISNESIVIEDPRK